MELENLEWACFSLAILIVVFYIHYMTVTSTAFPDKQLIPKKYTCEGENINPPLTFSQVPKETQSLVLIVDDPDAPSGDWVHWALYNMPSSTMQILENSVPDKTMQGKNGSGSAEYQGPCPPTGTHRYFFKLYALKITLDLPEGATKGEIEEAMAKNIIDQAEIIGLYKKE